ncbi:d-galactarate dehydratase / altronate hydrolase c terminus [Lucifera butyrica]|uniref:Galactarate dehydratase n=1 Tax=Lucifera butyrica TaxID=1351585 RepID=A0A498R8H5_9FIRM|nr:galactarate dehydratase [Lucifera butyrica]VBB07691.1 d-galactarate dehydratase / altronate hydrolase c terminus [Lucifera butyrica]
MDGTVAQQEKPLYIKLNAKDNVAIIVNAGGLPQGTLFPCGLELREPIPEGHKVALTDLNQDEPIIRYGEIIGYAVRPIKKGSWIDESSVMLPTPPNLDELPLANNVPELQPPLTGYTLEGYRNEDGSVGTKNILGISTSVQCVAGVLDYAVQRIKAEILPKYPNVDDVIALNHNYGCGVAINAPEAKIPVRTLQNLATHPNFGGEVLIVGLGCEKLLPEKLVPAGAAATVISLQDQPGFSSMVETIMAAAEERLARLNRRQRVTCPVTDLVVGLQCGGSDAFSGVTANPAVGYAADLLVRAGATVLFSEVTEVRDAIHLLTPRAVNEQVGQALIQEMKWYDHYLQLGEADRSANPAPGNKKGGLANVVEKSLGSIAKSGTSPIASVLPPGEKAKQKGLIYAATPASDFICGTLQLASGIHVQIFTTGRGTPYGLAMVPVVKVATRNSLANQWPDLIDVNAGKIATGEATIEAIGWEIFRLILDVASGRKQTWAEHWGLHNALCLFNPAPVT